MTISAKQLQANKENSKKGGVKTAQGKAITKLNALKHGLLAKEIVIAVGDGAENPEEFNAILGDLKTQLQPEGTLEEILVEKIAVTYWRLRRAYRYEVGLIRNELDSVEDEYYGQQINKADDQIEQEIQENQEEVDNWKKYAKQIQRMRKDGKPMEDTFELDEPWEWLHDKVSYFLPRDEKGETQIFGAERLWGFCKNTKGWDENNCWEHLSQICEEKIVEYTDEIADLGNQKEQNKLKLQVIKKLGCIPSKEELDRLLRYEGAIEKQLYKAINQLERVQRLRSGDNVPAPVEVDVNVNTGQLA